MADVAVTAADDGTQFRHLVGEDVETSARMRCETDPALVPNACACACACVVYNAFARRRVGEIVVTDHGYDAVTMGAERLARRRGGRIPTARVPLGADEDMAYEAVGAEMGEATDLIVVDQVTSATALRPPLERIGAEALRRGVPMLADGAHAPGLLAAPLADATFDLWTGNLHKWGCAPRGTPALVAHGPLRDLIHPLIDSWGDQDPYPDRFAQQGTLDATS
nr:aminotransferase class V-fold PLP-dependent enzyme [Streptomyces sp. NBC_01261]